MCGDDRCVIDGKPTGAIRASFGYMSTRRDADALVAFVAKYFVDKAAPVPCAALVSTCAAAAKKGSMSVREGVCVEAETGRARAANSSDGCVVPLELQGLQVVPDPSRLVGVIGETEDVAEAGCGEAGCGGMRHASTARDAPLPSLLRQSGVRESDEASRWAEESDGDVVAHMAAEDVAERQTMVVAETSAGEQRVQVEQSDGEGRGAEEGAGGVGNGEALVEGEVQEIYVYPIKSCAAHACLGAGGWPLTSTGLLYDRCVNTHARTHAHAHAHTHAGTRARTHTHAHTLRHALAQAHAQLRARSRQHTHTRTADASVCACCRMWTLVDAEGTAITQKVEPHLARIRPSLLLDAGEGGQDILRVTCAGKEELGYLEIPADSLPEEETAGAEGGGVGGGIRKFLAACGMEVGTSTARSTSVRVCGRPGRGISYGPKVNHWFTCALGRECILVRQEPPSAGRRVALEGETGVKGAHYGIPPAGPLSSASSTSSIADASSSAGQRAVRDGTGGGGKDVGGRAGSEGLQGSAARVSYHSNGGQLLMVTEESIAGLWRRLREAPPSEVHAVSTSGEDVLENLGRGCVEVGQRRSIFGEWEEARAELIMRLRPNLVVRRRGAAAASSGIADGEVGGEAWEGWEDGLSRVSFHSSPPSADAHLARTKAGEDQGMAATMRAQCRQVGERGTVGWGVGVACAKGPCFRCGMVNVDQTSGRVGVEPLLTLSSYRRDPQRGRVTFGLLLDLVSLSRTMCPSSCLSEADAARGVLASPETPGQGEGSEPTASSSVMLRSGSCLEATLRP